MDAEGHMCALVRPEIEHVPEAEERRHDGHGEDDEALDGNRQDEHQAHDDKYGQKSGSTSVGTKIPAR